MMRSGFIIFTILLFSNNILGQGSFGPPSNPTYGNVQSDIPQEYYQEADGTSGEDLKQAIYQIIRNHVVFPYTSSSTDTWDILEQSDQDPANNDNILLVYTDRSQDKGYRDGCNCYSDYENGTHSNSWNREHVWPKSHGFPDQDDVAYTDVHNLKPCDRSVNESRGTRDFDNGGNQHGEATECFYDGDSWEPGDSVKGDIARIIFYMVVRYDPGYDHNNNAFDLELVDYTTPGNYDPILGKLSSLLQWHIDDPVDDYEINRNDVIYSYQQNRNPFIDHPSLVSYIWGDNYGEQWNETLSISTIEFDENIKVYPNPTNGEIFFNSVLINSKIEIYSEIGKRVYDIENTNSNKIQLLLSSGVYIMKIRNNNKILYKKIIIN
ncbi:MAG: hypothetical protein CMC34_02955 [Flavobacteriaceae bacterium]|nr:hypothetical protein [Flavobacteriaceae bacterium]